MTLKDILDINLLWKDPNIKPENSDGVLGIVEITFPDGETKYRTWGKVYYKHNTWWNSGDNELDPGDLIVWTDSLNTIVGWNT